MSWRAEYLAALQARDQREQTTKSVVDAYTKLADRAAQLSKSAPPAEEAAPPAPPASPRSFTIRKPSSPAPAPPASTSSLRSDLLEAQKARNELQARVDVATAQLQKAQAQLSRDERRIRELAAEGRTLATKLRDRDEELRGKAKLIEEVQDENVSLTLQLNVSEGDNERLRGDNKDLVDRWMRRMGEEADQMNLNSKFK